LLFSFLVALPRGILHNSEWIGNDMKTKIHFLWQHAKAMQNHHFSEHSKVILKSRTLTIVDLSTLFRIIISINYSSVNLFSPDHNTMSCCFTLQRIAHHFVAVLQNNLFMAAFERKRQLMKRIETSILLSCGL
jgi:hypothetical protein